MTLSLCQRENCQYFQDSKDSKFCRYHLKTYLSPFSASPKRLDLNFEKIKPLLEAHSKNLSNDIEKVAKNESDIKKLLRISKETHKIVSECLKLAIDTTVTSSLSDQIFLVQQIEKCVFTFNTVDRLKRIITENSIQPIDNESVYIAADDTTLEERDQKLQEKLRNLQFVTPYMLGVENFDDRETSRDMSILNASIIKVIEVDAATSPYEKFQCIKQAIKLLVPKIAESKFTADDLIPLVITMIIKANPPQILTNVYFIELFHEQNMLNSGQAAFIFTQFSAAIRWLESPHSEKAKNYKLTKQQFEEFKDGDDVPVFVKRSVDVYAGEIEELRDILNKINKILQV